MLDERPVRQESWPKRIAQYIVYYPHGSQSYFEWFILLIIIANSALLAADSPDRKDDEAFQKLYQTLEVIFLVIFLFEAVIKIYAMGFFMAPKAYLRSGWNVIDFFILIISIFAFTPFVDNYSSIRALRVLRPLRTLNGRPALRMIVQGILGSLRGLANVLALSLFIFLVTGLLGVFFWKELFRQRCVVLDADGEFVPRSQLPAYFASLHYNQTLALSNTTSLSYTLSASAAATSAFAPTLTPTLLPSAPSLTHAVTPTRPGMSYTPTRSRTRRGGSSLLGRLSEASTPGMERWPFPPSYDVNAFALHSAQDYPDNENDALGQYCSMHAGNAPFTFAGRACVDPRISCTPWKNPHRGVMSFDHILNALLIIFQCVTEEGWVEVMYIVQDTWSWWGWTYFVVVVFLLSFVMLNLALAVIIEHYTQSGRKTNVIYQSPDDTIRVAQWDHGDDSAIRAAAAGNDSEVLLVAKWVTLLRVVRGWMLRLVLSDVFLHGILVAICVNTLTMAIDHHDMNDTLSEITSALNVVFTVVFLVEFVLKLFALGPAQYVRDRFNILDGVLVIASLVELAWAGGNTINVLRSFRLIRLVKLLRNVPSLRQLLEVLLRSVQDTGFLNVMLMLYLFVAGLVGMTIFGGEFDFAEGRPRAHFDNIAASVLSVFQVLTRDDWTLLMWDGMRATDPFTAAAFFLSLVLIGDFIILNLFLAILIRAFSEHQDAKMLQLEVQAGRERAGRNFQDALSAAEMHQSGSEDSDEDAELLAAARGQVHVKVAERGLLSPDAIGWRAVKQSALERAREIAALMPHDISAKRITHYVDDDGSEVVTVERDLVRGFAADLAASFTPLNETDGADAKVGRKPLDRTAAKLARIRGPTPAFMRVAEAARCRPTFTNGGYSLFCFAPNSPLRLTLWEFVHWSGFDRIILVLICLASLLMALEDPLNYASQSGITNIVWYINFVVTSLFVVEMVLKIVARGFFLHPGAYLRNGWDVLDCIIVVISVVSLLFQRYESSGVRILRAFRALRPLRVLNRTTGLRMVVLTLFRALPGIGNVVIVAVLVFAVFAILATNQFQGQSFYCTIDQPLEEPCVQFDYQCNANWTYADVIRNCTAPSFPGVNCTDNCVALARTLAYGDLNAPLVPQAYHVLEWDRYPRHFDNFFASLLTLFEIATLEYWQPILYQLMDATGPFEVPHRDQNVVWPPVFVVVFIVVGHFFTLNLFVGVVIFNYNMVKRRMDNQPLFVTPEQRNWQDMHQMMLKFTPQLRPIRPKGRLSAQVYDLVVSRPFELFIGLMIVLNVGVLLTDHADSSAAYKVAMDSVDVLFMFIFVTEAVLKLTAFRWLYFKDSWNNFDLFLALVAIVSTLLTTMGNVFKLPIDASALQVLRVFRIARVIRLVKAMKDIRVLIETLIYSLPALGNMGAFLFLIYFIFSVFGMQVFAGVRGVELGHHANFDTFPTALLTLFRCTTGEVWNNIMHDLMVSPPRCGAGSESPECPASPWIAPLFFVLFLVMSTFVIFNLFIAIILDNFNITIAIEKTTLRMTHLVSFKEEWSKFDPEATYIIPTNRFAVLLQQIGPPLGVKNKYRNNRRHLIAKCKEYNIPEHAGEVHFMECLISLARSTMGIKMTESEILDQEVVWRQYLPELAKLPVVTYRSKRTTLDHYLGATLIAAWYQGWKVRSWYKRVREARRTSCGLRRLPGYVVRSSAAMWMGMRTQNSSALDVAGVASRLLPNSDAAIFFSQQDIKAINSTAPPAQSLPRKARKGGEDGQSAGGKVFGGGSNRRSSGGWHGPARRRSSFLGSVNAVGGGAAGVLGGQGSGQSGAAAGAAGAGSGYEMTVARGDSAFVDASSAAEAVGLPVTGNKSGPTAGGVAKGARKVDEGRRGLLDAESGDDDAVEEEPTFEISNTFRFGS